MLDRIVAQARDEAPNECCGIVGARDGRAVAVYPVRNAAASPLRYEMDPKDQLRVFEALDDAELEIGAIYHSHTRSAPEPSQTDINLAFYPDARLRDRRRGRGGGRRPRLADRRRAGLRGVARGGGGLT